MKFIERFYKHVSENGGCLHTRPLSPLDIELDPKILWEEQKNDELKLVRSLIIRYVDEELAEVLKGNGEAYMGGNDELMAPYRYEKLDIDIPSDNVDIEQVWKLYEAWLMKWTPAKELRQLVGEPIRDGKTEKGSESAYSKIKRIPAFAGMSGELAHDATAVVGGGFVGGALAGSEVGALGGARGGPSGALGGLLIGGILGGIFGESAVEGFVGPPSTDPVTIAIDRYGID